MKERGDILGLIGLLADEKSRSDAIQILTEIGAPAFKPLDSVLRDRNLDARWDTNVFAESLQRLLMRFSDKYPESRRQTLSLIWAASGSPSTLVRLAAVQEPFQIPNLNAVYLLMDTVVDPRPEVSDVALRKLKEISGGEVFGKNYPSWNHWFFEKFGILGKYYCLGRVIGSRYTHQEGVPASDYNPDRPDGYCTGQAIDVEIIQTRVSCFDRDCRCRVGGVIEGFWSYGGDSAIVGKPKVGDIVGHFEEAYSIVWEKVRSAEEALQNLTPNFQKMEDEKDVRGLIQALRHRDMTARAAAAEALGFIGDVRAVEPLIQALKEACQNPLAPDYDGAKWDLVLWAVEDALRMIGEPAVQPLIEALKDESEDVRIVAANALKSLKR
jgi:hypothetical protein